MTALADRPLLYPARPTLNVAGQSRPDLATALTALTVCESVDGLYALEATLGNWGTSQGEIGYLYFDRSLLDFGVDIDVEFGAGQAEGPVFSGRITAIEGRFPVSRPPEITILAEDRFQDLRMTRRTRSFDEPDTETVIRQIASDHGLQPDIDVDDITYPVIAQVNQSDLAFARELARTIDAELWIDDNTLHMKARTRRQTEVVELIYGQTLREFQVIADLAHQRSRVSVSGWDPGSKSGIDEEATDTALASEIASLESGASVLSASGIGERADRLVHQMPTSTNEARAAANARFRRCARRFVVGHGVAEGDARIRVGAGIDLRDLGPLFNGEYYVCECRHTFDQQSGYRTSFTAERPGIGRV
jgi:phage protein D